MKLACGCLKDHFAMKSGLEKLVVWQLEARYAVIGAALAISSEIERCFVSSYA